MPTISTVLPVKSQSPAPSAPRIRAATPAVAIAVEKYASARAKIVKPMNANALGQLGFFIGEHSISASSMGQSHGGTSDRLRRNRSFVQARSAAVSV